MRLWQSMFKQKLLQKLVPHQCLGGIWSRRCRSKEAATVLATVNQFNAVSLRVISTVLTDSNCRPAERARLISTWIDIAQVNNLENDIYTVCANRTELWLEHKHKRLPLQAHSRSGAQSTASYKEEITCKFNAIFYAGVFFYFSILMHSNLLHVRHNWMCNIVEFSWFNLYWFSVIGIVFGYQGKCLERHTNRELHSPHRTSSYMVHTTDFFGSFLT